MTIKRGDAWGQVEKTPHNLRWCETDRDADDYLTNQILTGSPVENIAIRKSNVGREVGLSGATSGRDTMLMTKFDVVRVQYELVDRTTKTEFFLGHALLRKSLIRGEVTGVFNTSFIKNFNCAPRSHPNDGKLDILQVDESMSLRQRLAARRLMKLGAHLPHPKIRYFQTNQHTTQNITGVNLFVDSKLLGCVNQCEFESIPDAVSLYW